VADKESCRRRPHPDAVAEAFEGELLLLHLGHGTTFRLNRTGKVIWQLAGDGLTEEQITCRVQARFAVLPEQARHDVAALLNGLEQHHLLERVAEAA